MTKTIPLAQPSSLVQEESQLVEIPKHLPLIVRDVAESLVLRDRTSTERYLDTYQQKKHG